MTKTAFGDLKHPLLKDAGFAPVQTLYSDWLASLIGVYRQYYHSTSGLLQTLNSDWQLY